MIIKVTNNYTDSVKEKIRRGVYTEQEYLDTELCVNKYIYITITPHDHVNISSISANTALGHRLIDTKQTPRGDHMAIFELAHS